LTVTEQEIADGKAIIGRDGIGCEPASATTVAGIKKMKAEGTIQPNESVVAVLTGHVLKDTDYVNKYHNNSLETDQTRILPTYGNMPIKVSGGRDELRRVIEELQKE
jgi:Threonine synthase